MKIRQRIAKEIWDFCEFYNLPLGRLAPHVFGWMVGCKGKRIDNRKDHR